METSVRVKSDTEGLYIGHARGAEQDGEGNDRDITLVIHSHRQASPDYTSPTRTVVADGETGTDETDYGSDFAGVPSDVLSSAVTVGDKPTLVVYAHVEGNFSGSAGFVLTPLILDSSNRVMARLQPKLFEGFQGPGDSKPHGYYDSTALGDYVICEAATWDVRGAQKIGLHVSGQTNFSKAKIWAAMVSCAADGAIAAARSTDGSYSTTFDSSSGGE